MTDYPLIEAFLAMVVVVGLMIACLFIMHIICETYTAACKSITGKFKKFFKSR